MYLDSLRKTPRRYQDNGAGWPTPQGTNTMTSSRTANPYPSIPFPAGAVLIDGWNDMVHLPHAADLPSPLLDLIDAPH
jgi:hypothetical protein